MMTSRRDLIKERQNVNLMALAYGFADFGNKKDPLRPFFKKVEYVLSMISNYSTFAETCDVASRG
jgi:hypothetical protein